MARAVSVQANGDIVSQETSRNHSQDVKHMQGLKNSIRETFPPMNCKETPKALLFHGQHCPRSFENPWWVTSLEKGVRFGVIGANRE